MHKFIIDTSVIVKWIITDNEAGVDDSLELLRLLKSGEISLFAPSFLLIELINILYWKRKLAKEEIRSFIERVAKSGINFIDPLKIDAEKILELVLEKKTTSYDAIFLHQAMNMNAKLISADKQLLEIKDLVVTTSQALEMLK